MAQDVEQLVIIGSGPAGLTAAIYAARGNRKPIVVAGRGAGGQLMLTTDVDDFPGFPEGTQGPDLMIKMRAQAERFDTRFVDEDVVSVDFNVHPFVIKTESQELQAKSVILATGASAKWLGLDSEEKMIGRGVSACAVCDGLFFRGKDVIVVGGGDVAMREAQHLSHVAATVTVVHRRDELRAQAALQTLLKSMPNVKFIFNSTVEEIMGEDRVTGVKLKDTLTGEMTEKAIEGVFVAIGHQPNTGFLNGQIKLDEKGYILVTDNTKTSVEGVFVAGDVADHKYRQGVTAAGAGCMAALDADWYLDNLH